MPARGTIYGTHHLTFCVGTAQEDYDFHVRLLGLKSVKKTVLFDGETSVIVSPTFRCLSLANSSRITASLGPSFEMSVAAPGFHVKRSTFAAVAGSIPSTGIWSSST